MECAECQKIIKVGKFTILYFSKFYVIKDLKGNVIWAGFWEPLPINDKIFWIVGNYIVYAEGNYWEYKPLLKLEGKPIRYMICDKKLFVVIAIKKRKEIIVIIPNNYIKLVRIPVPKGSRIMDCDDLPYSYKLYQVKDYDR